MLNNTFLINDNIFPINNMIKKIILKKIDE